MPFETKCSMCGNNGDSKFGGSINECVTVHMS